MGELLRAGYEGLVLDHERDLGGRDGLLQARVGTRVVRAVDEILLDGVLQDVRRGLAGVDVEPGDAVGVVVVEHQPGALLVGVIEGQRAGAGIVRRARRARRNDVAVVVEPHVGDELHTGAPLVGGRIGAGRRPLIRCAVADPRSGAAVQVQGGAVLCVVTSERTHARAHDGGVHRQEEVAGGAGRQVVRELDAHRPIPLRDDRRSQVLGTVDGVDLGAVAVQDGAAVRVLQGDVLALCGVGRRLDLHVAAQRRRRQVLAQLLGVLDQADLVVVGMREGRRVGDRDGDVLSEVVRGGPPQSGQRVDELADAAP